jgi:hypothetical protein
MITFPFAIATAAFVGAATEFVLNTRKVESAETQKHRRIDSEPGGGGANDRMLKLFGIAGVS